MSAPRSWQEPQSMESPRHQRTIKRKPIPSASYPLRTQDQVTLKHPALDIGIRDGNAGNPPNRTEVPLLATPPFLPSNPVLATSNHGFINGANRRESGQWQSHEEPHSPDIHPETHVSWKPIWLRLGVLLSFCCTFLFSAIAVGTLHHLSQRDHGISTQIDSNRYYWRYGPTVAVVLMLAAWRRVSYQVKVLAPWANMAHGHARAVDSVLLDYLSPILPTSLWSALRRRDWVVSACMINEILLRIILVFSTSLFALKVTSLSTANTGINVVSTLDASRYQAKQSSDGSPDTVAARRYTTSLVQGIGFPYGTTEKYAFETIDESSLNQDTVITARLKAFVPDFKCQVPQTTSKVITDPLDLRWRVARNFTTASNQIIRDQDILIPFCSASRGAITSGVDCNLKLQTGIQADWVPWMVASNSSLTGNMATLTIFTWEYGRPASGSSDWALKSWNQSSIVCEASYSFTDAYIAFDGAKKDLNGGVTSVQIIPTPGTDRIKDLSATDLFMNVSTQTFSIYPWEVPSHTDFLNTTFPGKDPFITLMLVESGARDITTFMEASLLQESAAAVFKGIAAQIIGQEMRLQTHRRITAEASLSVSRLVVNRLNTCVIISIFCLVATGVVVVIVRRPKDAIGDDPGLILTSARILGRSPDLTGFLLDCGKADDHQLCSRAADHSFWTRLEKGARVIETTGDPYRLESDRLDSTTIKGWWRPFSISLGGLTLALLLPVLVLVVLEVLQRVSDMDHGFASVSNPSSTVASLALILTTITLIVITMILEAIYFNVTVLTAFHILRRGAHSISMNFVGQTPTAVLGKSMPGGYWLAAISSLSVLLASFLTIVASGLFTIQNFPQYVDTTLVSTENFSLERARYISDPNADYIYNDNGAGVAFDQLEWLNGTYPSMTYDELALPNLRLATNSSASMQGHQANGRILADPLAFRAGLACNFIDRDQLDISYAHYVSHTHDSDSDDHHMLINTPRLPTPDGCTYYKYGMIHEGATKALDLDIQFSNLPAEDHLYAGTMGYLTMTEASCPSLYFAFGDILWNNTAETELTVMVCRQTFESVRTNTTLQWSVEEGSWELDYSAPPVAVSAARDNDLEPMNPDITLSFSTNVTSVLTHTEDQSSFFGVLLRGKAGIPANELVGVANRVRFLAGINHEYRRYMAQFANLNLRVPNTLAETETTYAKVSAKEQLSSQARIVIHRSSRITLQVLLAAVALCVLAVWIVGRDMKTLLPHNPCTIAGVMSLLAGSSICAPHTTATPTRQTGLLQGKVASNGENTPLMQYVLGWWDDGKSRRFGIDIGARPPSRDKHLLSGFAPPSARVKIKRLFSFWEWNGSDRHGSEKGVKAHYHTLGKDQGYAGR